MPEILMSDSPEASELLQIIARRLNVDTDGLTMFQIRFEGGKPVVIDLKREITIKKP